MITKPKIIELEDILATLDFQPDAVSVDEQTLAKLMASYQQMFESPIVTISNVEDYLSVKILVGESIKEEFKFWTHFKK
jgi:hypothetical protein